VDLQGKPWNPKRVVVEYAGEVQDGKFTKGAWKGMSPMVPGRPWPIRWIAQQGRPVAVHHAADGYGAIFGPGLKDGPFPEHYEPMECPVEKNLMSAQFVNPVAAVFKSDQDVVKTCDPRFPFVGTTYR